MINSKGINAVKSILGDDIFEVLEKNDTSGGMVKLNTQTVISPGEIKVALQIVPRTILSYLFANCKWRETGEAIDLELPFAMGARLMANKKGPDNYSGEIIKEGKRLIEFKHRSLPSIGLMILTTFELYDMALLDEVKGHKPEEKETSHRAEKLQDIIDERLSMHRAVQDVVDRRISEREAINKLIKERLSSHIAEVNSPEGEEEEMEETKKSKLREFLESREKKRQEDVVLDKTEVKCPDCDNTLHKSGDKNIKLCICYGDNMNKEIKIKKNDKGTVNLKFPKSFEIDNIEMLLEALKQR